MTQPNKEPKEKKKKVDYRKWANKYLKPGAMPPSMSGIGDGLVLYCPECDLQCLQSTFKDKWYCNACGAELIKMTKPQFKAFRAEQKVDNDKNTNTDIRK